MTNALKGVCRGSYFFVVFFGEKGQYYFNKVKMEKQGEQKYDYEKANSRL